jgi:cytochrome c-type biogenesis protein CcmE
MGLATLLWSFNGRISRGEFWLGILLSSLSLIVVEIGVRLLAAGAGGGAAGGLVAVLMVVGTAVAVAATVAVFAVYIKRFHDRGGSGWWSLLLLVPLLQFWAVIECGFLAGMREANAYGPAPKGLTRKQRRLTLVTAGLTVCGFAAALIVVALSIKGSMSFFVTPTEIAEHKFSPGIRIRVGGLVEDGSVVRGSDLRVSFKVTDGKTEIPVTYQGVLPDLFREGQGVVAEGTLDTGGTFNADTILAKHDENYMPKEVAEALKKSGHWRDDYTQGGPRAVTGANK